MSNDLRSRESIRAIYSAIEATSTGNILTIRILRELMTGWSSKTYSDTTICRALGIAEGDGILHRINKRTWRRIERAEVAHQPELIIDAEVTQLDRIEYMLRNISEALL